MADLTHKNFLCFLLIFAAFSQGLATSDNSHVPVLIWSSNSLSSMESPLAGHTVSKSTFDKDFLGRIPSNKVDHHNTVVFVQDMLSLEDFTQFGDPYNSMGNGGLFHSVKDLMEENPSLTLSSVETPYDSLESLEKTFLDNVQEYTGGSSLESLKKTGKNLIIIKLDDTRKNGQINKKVLTTNDKYIGYVIGKLKSLGVPYTALYTAKTNPIVKRDLGMYSTGRHLLADVTIDSNDTFVNHSDCLYFFAKKVSVVVTHVNGKVVNIAQVLDKNPDHSGCKCGGNETTLMELKWGKQGVLDQVIITMNFTSSKLGEWTATEMSISYKGKTNDTTFEGKDIPLNAKFVTAPRGFSYHCFPDTTFTPSGVDNSTDQRANVVISSLQIQPYDIKNDQFSAANDCVTFFTIPIWSGLFATFILVAILTFGLMMIANISTQDRFDDPKGATLTINTGE